MGTTLALFRPWTFYKSFEELFRSSIEVALCLREAV